MEVASLLPKSHFRCRTMFWAGKKGWPWPLLEFFPKATKFLFAFCYRLFICSVRVQTLIVENAVLIEVLYLSPSYTPHPLPTPHSPLPSLVSSCILLPALGARMGEAVCSVGNAPSAPLISLSPAS